MFKRTRIAIMSILIVSSFPTGRASAGAAEENLPDRTTAGFVEKLYRVDCGHSLCQRRVGVDPGRERRKEH